MLLMPFDLRGPLLFSFILNILAKQTHCLFSFLPFFDCFDCLLNCGLSVCDLYMLEALFKFVFTAAAARFELVID